MGSWELDLRSGETVWSGGMYRILGLPPAEQALDRAEILEHVHADDRDRMERMLAGVVDRPEEVPERGLEIELRMVRADGSVRELRAMGRVESDGGRRPVRWIGSVLDVTEQRLSERELRAHYSVSQALREWESFELGVVDLLRRIATALDYPMASLWLWDASAVAMRRRRSTTPSSKDSHSRNAWLTL